MRTLTKGKRRAVGRSHRGFRWTRKFRREYARFIKSPEWEQIREAKLQSVNWTCEDCPPQPPRHATHVHHENYTRFGGAELLTDLRALCKDCHERVHHVRRQHGGLWLSTRVAADHAMTQFGVDIRQRLIDSYQH